MGNRTPIEVVQGFKTTDDEIFYDRAEAIDHQTDLELGEDLMKLLEKDLYHDMTPDDIVDMLVEKRKKLKHLFSKINN